MHVTNPLLLPLLASIIALAWGAVIQRSRNVRRDFRDAISLAYWAGFLALALTVTLPLPPVMAEIDRVFDAIGLADFLADTASLTTCWFWLSYLYRLNAADNTRRPIKLRLLLALIIGAVIVNAGRFVAAPDRVGF